MPAATRSQYDEELQFLDDLVGAAVKVSTVSGGVWRLNRYIVATQLYTRLAIAAMTFLRSLPHNRFLVGVEDSWDWPSAASLTRNVLEMYLSFFYIGVDEIDDDDSDFRLRLFNYHNNYEKWRLYRDFGVADERLTDFTAKLPDAKARLQAHGMFGRLTEEQKRRVVSSKHALYMSRAEIRQRLPFPATEIPLFYRFLSHQVHSTPFAALSQSNERGRGIENETERTYLIWAIRLWRKYLGASIVGIDSYFRDHFDTLKEPELDDARFIGKASLDRIVVEGVGA